MAPHFLEVRRRFRREFRAHHVPAILFLFGKIVAKRDDLRPLLHQAFREEKPGGQFEVVPRRPHGDTERLIAHANFERLLSRKIVLLAPNLAVVPL